MSQCAPKCREPLCSMLITLTDWVTSTYPDTMIDEPHFLDREGWIDYAASDGQGGKAVFAGARFRRDKPMGMTVVLVAKPQHDPKEWVHEDIGKLRPLGFAFGVPRPFEKGLSEEEWQYVFDLIVQAREASLIPR